MDKSTIIQLINILILAFLLLGYPGFLIAAIVSLKKRKLSKGASILWAINIIFVPFLGAIAIWIVNPKSVHDNDS